LTKFSPQVNAVLVGFLIGAPGAALIDYAQNPEKSYVTFYATIIIGVLAKQVPAWSLLVVAAVLAALWYLTRRSTGITAIPGPQVTAGIENGDEPVAPAPLMTIDEPLEGSSHPIGDIWIKGSYSGRPARGKAFAVFTKSGNTYWPKGRFVDNLDGTWSCVITETRIGETTIVAAQVDVGVYLWVDLYGYVGNKYGEWVGATMRDLSESIRPDQVMTIKITPKQT
jgi:hypothetical protein